MLIVNSHDTIDQRQIIILAHRRGLEPLLPFMEEL